MIARAALKNFRLANGATLPLDTTSLARVRDTRSQTGLTRHQRRINMRGAFAVVNQAAIAGRDIIVVDDVFTTGTTVSECARVLRRAGANRVLVATVARVLKPDVVRSLSPPLGTKKAMAAHA
jgi:predicted amidophosphoribosyltransferase